MFALWVGYRVLVEPFTSKPYSATFFDHEPEIASGDNRGPMIAFGCFDVPADSIHISAVSTQPLLLRTLSPHRPTGLEARHVSAGGGAGRRGYSRT